MLEAELVRNLIVQQGSLGYRQTDQIVGDQIDPQLFDSHLRGPAAQMFHAGPSLDIAQVQFAPAFVVQSGDKPCWQTSLVHYGGDQYHGLICRPLADPDIAGVIHSQPIK